MQIQIQSFFPSLYYLNYKIYLISQFPIFSINYSLVGLLYSIWYYFQTMEIKNSNGFRRRGGISAIKDIKTIPRDQLNNVSQIKTKYQANNQVKFKKINQNNHAILKNRKKQQEFQKTIDEIMNRKCTFYKLGFKSYEKTHNKKIFGEVLGLGTAQMKGTMQIGQLWTNHENSKFLKQNKIFMTKLKLIDTLQILKQEFDQQTLNRSDNLIQSCMSIQTKCQIGSSLFSKQLIPYENSKRKQINSNVESLKRQLKILTRQSGLRMPKSLNPINTKFKETIFLR